MSVNKDESMTEFDRRHAGAYFTKLEWAKVAHDFLESRLGSDWRDKYIVWDCAAGTGNLTREYDFDNLLLSTLDQEEVDIIVEEELNGDACVFQYDFLSCDPLPADAQMRLDAAVKTGKTLLFLINPPYATSADMKRANKLKQKGMAVSQVKQRMRDAKMGRSSNNLYMQFLYRCATIAEELGFKDHVVAPFSPISYMCNTSNEKFISWWYSRFEFNGGFMFQAKHFHGCSGAWAVTFTLWVSGGQTLTRALPLDIKEVVKKDKKEVITTTGVKTVRWVAKKDQLSTWLREPTKNKKRKRQILKIRRDPPQQVEAVPLSSGLSVGESEVTLSDEAVGSLVNGCNVIHQNCCLLSSTFGHAGSASYDLEVGESWRRAIVALAARSLPNHTWINHQDELQSPQGSYDQWVDDLHVAALFFPKNNMTAMRDVKYNGKTWTLHNHSFWLTRQQATDFYKDAKVWKLVADARFYPTKLPNGDPYMSRLPLNLSPDVYELLVDLTALWIDSIPYREAADEDLHLTAWDAGVYQHKKLWATIPHLEERWNTLREKSRKVEDRLRDGIYKYKILVN